jgi:hypothetical protein
MDKRVVFLLLVTTLLAGCLPSPTGEVSQPPIKPGGVDEIVKGALPQVDEEEPQETEPVIEEETEEPQETEPVIEEEPEELQETEPVTEEEAEGGSASTAKITVQEGELVKLDLDATDPDGDSLYYTYTLPLNRLGEWQTQIGDAGEYPITITVSDGVLKTSKDAVIIVTPVNQPPRFKELNDIEVVEGELIELELEAEDPNNDPLLWSYGQPFSADGKWQTQEGDAGKYEVTVEVSDGEFTDSGTMFVTILRGNRPPHLDIDSELEFNEGDTIKLEPEVSDPDGDQVTVKYSGWMNSGTYTTGNEDAGKHKVVITVSDGKLEESAVVWITIKNVNRPPEIHGLIVK